MPSTHHAEVLEAIATQLANGELSLAKNIAAQDYPFTLAIVGKRSISQATAMKVFLRDGFIDRYFGMRLVFPGALLLIGELMPECFPIHKTWRVSESHHMYWELWPAVDHLEPFSRGGTNSIENLFSTSVLHNNAKAQWTLDEIGWEIHPPGNVEEWDGLLNWCLSWIDANPTFQPSRTLNGWLKTARRVSP